MRLIVLFARRFDALPDDGAGRKQAARKVSVVLAVAMLMLALACAAVAAGLGVFGKLAEQTASAGYSELYRALDEKSVVLDETQNSAKCRRTDVSAYAGICGWGNVCLWPMS